MKKVRAQGARRKAQGRSASNSKKMARRTVRGQHFSLQPPASSRATDWLLEIGSEELPAAYIDSAVAQLQGDAQRLLSEQHLTFRKAEAFGTPRRLVLIVSGLQPRQRHPAEEIRGPSGQAAYKDGQPTGALLGFLKSRGGELSHVKLVKTDKGEYVYLVKSERQSPTVDALPELAKQLIARLRFPKTMRWDNSGFRFARPVRWLLSLYGQKPVAVEIGNLKSGRHTRIGGPKRPKPAQVSSPDAYLAILNKAGILLDQRVRRRQIEQMVRAQAAKHGGAPVAEMISHGLLDEVTGLVEQPVPLPGQFDAKYLALPREVLLASMAKHQRVFAIEARGTLVPAFIGILDGPSRKPQHVRTFCEHILNARLADSLLFWNQDRKMPLDQVDLSGVTVHERLGSMADKARRLVALAKALAQAWSLSQQESMQLERACLLAKADLVTMMVKEFPTLQGVMGKHYARAAGEDKAVAEAIEEQYLPVGVRLPSTVIGSALAILEKYDTLVQYFAIGIKPTGDQDPFGLRRAAQGIVEVAWNLKNLPDAYPERRLDLTPLRQVCTSNGWHPTIGLGVVCDQVKSYLLERLSTFEWLQPTPSADVIAAVLSVPGDDLVDVMSRIEKLQQIRLQRDQVLLRAAKVVERTHNILKAAKLQQPEVDPAKLQEPSERALWDVYCAKKDRLQELINGRDYIRATEAYGEAFFEPLNRFFNQVMVNVKDEAIQQNRFALLRAIKTLYTDRVADLSKLTILQ